MQTFFKSFLATKDGMTITMGSDCSGIGTDAIALARLGVKFENIFASETDVHCRDVLERVLAVND